MEAAILSPGVGTMRTSPAPCTTADDVKRVIWGQRRGDIERAEELKKRVFFPVFEVIWLVCMYG